MRIANAIAILLATVLCGCETAKPVVVKGNSYCKLARPISWSTDDTRPTISEIRASNARYRRVCR